MAESLEERIERVEKMAQRALDFQEVANLMGRQVFMHEAGMDPQFPDTIFAQKTPGTSWEVAYFGKWVNEGIRKPLSKHGNYPIGTLFEHTLTSPVIEIAGDGKTAKGVWMSPGHETAEDLETRKLRSYWCWSKYGCDFVKEDGKWKLWHYHSYRTFRTPFDVSWVDYNEAEKTETIGRETTEAHLGLGEPDLPTTYDHPYSPKTLPELVPEPPEPYETFDDLKAY